MAYYLHDDRADRGPPQQSYGPPRGGGRMGGYRRPEPYNRGGRAATATKLNITGLARGVGWRELKDAFADAGPVTRANVDGNGNGDVTFVERADAMWAIKNWSKRPFLGSTITITLAEGGGDGGRGGRAGSGNGKAAAAGGGKAGRDKPKTAEDLEKEMDAYWGKKGGADADADTTADASAGAGGKGKKGKGKKEKENKEEPTPEALDADMEKYWAAKKEAADGKAAEGNGDAGAAEPAAAAADE